MKLDSNIGDWFDRNENDDDHYTQPGVLFNTVMDDQERRNLVDNIVSSMSGISGKKKDEIINRQLCHFFRADPQLGIAVAKELGVSIDEKAMVHVK